MRHHTLTQNLKAVSLWILLLIRCSTVIFLTSFKKNKTFIFLSDVGHITHTCTQHSPSSVNPFIHHASPEGESSYLLVSSLLISPQRTGCLGRTLRRTGAMIPLLGHEGSQGDSPHRDLNNHTSEKDTTLLPKTLRSWVYESSYL